MRLIVLGSGGWMPTAQRQTCAYLLELEGILILIDTGTGVMRLHEYKHILAAYDTLHIVFTHYHLDHIAGLGYLPAFTQGMNLHFWGPGRPYYSRSCEETLMLLTQSPFFSLPIPKFGRETFIHDYDETGFEIEGLSIQTMLQQHADPSFGLSFGRYLHFATDTELLPETLERATQRSLLLHECWQVKGKGGGHTYAQDLRAALESYAISRLVLIHANPLWSEEEALDVLRTFETSDRSVHIATDGMELFIA